MEIWKAVPEYEGLYEVSNLGQVRSLRLRNSLVDRLRETPLILSPKVEKRNRRIVQLYGLRGERTKKYRFVYDLVLSAFVGPRPPKMHACHWDGNSSNDRLENLRWDTASANCRDNIRLGIRQGALPGVGHHNVRLTEDQVRAIRDQPRYKGVIVDLAAKYGLSPGYVSQLRSREFWKHIP